MTSRARVVLPICIFSLVNWACVAAGRPLSPTTPTMVPAKPSDCTLSSDAMQELFNLKAVTRLVSEKRESQALTQTVQLKSGILVTATIGGCVHLGMKIVADKVPDGGIGRMPMYRVRDLIDSLPFKSDTAKSIAGDLHKTADAWAKKEKPSPELQAFHEGPCNGDSTCSFSWTRHKDQSLGVEVIYSFPL